MNGRWQATGTHRGPQTRATCCRPSSERPISRCRSRRYTRHTALRFAGWSQLPDVSSTMRTCGQDQTKGELWLACGGRSITGTRRLDRDLQISTLGHDSVLRIGYTI